MNDHTVLSFKHTMTFTVRRPSFMDRVLFAVRHLRCCRHHALSALRRRTTGLHHPLADGMSGTFYIVPGSWKRWWRSLLVAK